MFGFHRANLLVRFVIEVAAFVLLGFGGYAVADGAFAWILALGLPMLAMSAWATFNVPGDRSRNGRAPVPVPGPVRLALEWGVLVAAVVFGWFASPIAATVLAIAVIVHYGLSVDRIGWLVHATGP
ncbi:MAG: YrdB family protein [Acidimicrobiia bacterium]|nr:YrdB family protein [Acidimicrobiia bacterium]